MKSNWRIILAGLLFGASIWMFALSRMPRDVPAWHENTEAGFRIEPPAGWTSRTDDADGSQIAPPAQPDDGFAMLIVTTRLAHGENPMGYLLDVANRPAVGPIRELEWLRKERGELKDGGPGSLGEFTEIYRGQPVHGWMVFAVREGRVLQAVGTVPEAYAEGIEGTMIQSLLSLHPL